MTCRVDLSRDLGGGRTLMATPAVEGGWWLVLASGGEVLAKDRITQMQLARIVKGNSYVLQGFEVRGLRHETEFRIGGALFDRIKHAELVELIAEADLTRTPNADRTSPGDC